MAELLRGPTFPHVIAFLWEWFLELDATRGVKAGADAPVLLPITYREIDSWANTCGIRLRPHYTRAIKTLDTTMLIASSNQSNQRK